jgi:hypothetical protein
MAVGSFFEGGGAEQMDEPENFNRHILDAADDDEDDEDLVVRNSNNRNIHTSQGPTANSAASIGFSRPPAPQKKSTSDRPRIATLNDHRSDDEEEDEEQGQAFYAGGSERSGQQIIGPPAGKKPNPEDYIKSLFQKAKEYTSFLL